MFSGYTDEKLLCRLVSPLHCSALYSTGLQGGSYWQCTAVFASHLPKWLIKSTCTLPHHILPSLSPFFQPLCRIWSHSLSNWEEWKNECAHGLFNIWVCNVINNCSCKKSNDDDTDDAGSEALCGRSGPLLTHSFILFTQRGHRFIIHMWQKKRYHGVSPGRSWEKRKED